MAPSSAEIVHIRQESEQDQLSHLAKDFTDSLKRSKLLIATIDAEIRNGLNEFLESYSIKATWAKSVAEIKAAVCRQNITACLSGFWLVDGTYRDVIRHVKRQQTEIPMIVLCPPACSQEHQDSFAALNIRAFDFICYPYRREDLERVLHAAISSRPFQAQTTTAPENPSSHCVATTALRRAS